MPRPELFALPRTDRRIEADIHAALRERSMRCASVTVRVINGEVLLWGRVATLGERAAIGRIALGIAGVRTIENDIECQSL